eukprot:764706-Hanusia_phi.AAC.12
MKGAEGGREGGGREEGRDQRIHEKKRSRETMREEGSEWREGGRGESRSGFQRKNAGQMRAKGEAMR